LHDMPDHPGPRGLLGHTRSILIDAIDQTASDGVRFHLWPCHSPKPLGKYDFCGATRETPV
jgi:hypothetical protein